MKLTLDWIQNKAANPAVFSRAQSSFKDAKIAYRIIDQSAEHWEIIANISDKQGIYNVKIQLNKELLTSVDQCSCGAFHTMFGACKHVLMTFLKIYGDQKQNRLMVYSGKVAKPDGLETMIAAYESLGISKSVEKSIHPYDSVPLNKEIKGSEQDLEALSCLDLTPTQLDHDFAAHFNNLKNGDPPLQFSLLEIEGDYKLKTNFQSFQLLSGQHHLYFVDDDHKIYRCTPPFSKLLRPLLEVLAEAPGFEMSFSKADLGRFLAYVLPKIKEYVPDQHIRDLLKNFKEEPLVIKYYLEALNPSQIMMRIEFCYGNMTILADDSTSYRKYPTLLRNVQQEAEALKPVIKYQFIKTPKTGSYEIRDDDHIYRFLHEGLVTLDKMGEVYTADSIRNLKIKEFSQFSIGVAHRTNWIHLNFDDLNFDATSYEQIYEAYKQRKNYFRLKDGSFLRFKDQAIENFVTLMEDLNLSASDLKNNVISVPSYRALYLDQFTNLNPVVNLKSHSSFKRMIQTLKEAEVADFDIPDSLQPVLRTYQKKGYRWLKTLAFYGFGGILADDMGLGKTLQMITLLLAEISHETKPSLIVTPSSLMDNWQREIVKFAPSLKALVVRGDPSQRQMLIEENLNSDVLITSYDLIRRDIEHFEQREFNYCILDEAHYIKNHDTKNARTVKKIQSKHRFALTGTPIENSLGDLWSIFDFILPGYLGTYRSFKKKYEVPIVKLQQTQFLERIHQQVAPFILRRLKTDVLKELPSKIETNLYCEMEKKQKELYVATLYQMKKSLTAEVKAKGIHPNRMQVLTHLMRLRQICCHPSLYLDNYDGESAKLKLCLQLIEDCLASHHKILLFSQFTSMLDLLATALNQKQIAYFKLTGSTPTEKRVQLTEEFNRDETPIFLISLKAGGTGLNLTGADVVIHYDPWWNMSAQVQATDRAHRIGQEKTVQVFKLITKESIEEKIEELQQRKLALTDAVIKEGEALITDQEIMALFESHDL